MFFPDECEHGISIMLDCNACEPTLDPTDYGCAPFTDDDFGTRCPRCERPADFLVDGACLACNLTAPRECREYHGFEVAG